MSTYERFRSHVDRSGGVRACWPWTGPTNGDGVGVFCVRGRRTTARRWAYRMQEDPGSLRVVVTCGTRSCCNPRHLTLRTPRAVAIGNGSAAARNAAKTHCPAGHRLAGAGVYLYPDGRRGCRRCRAAGRDPGPGTGWGVRSAAWGGATPRPPEGHAA